MLDIHEVQEMFFEGSRVHSRLSQPTWNRLQTSKATGQEIRICFDDSRGCLHTEHAADPTTLERPRFNIISFDGILSRTAFQVKVDTFVGMTFYHNFCQGNSSMISRGSDCIKVLYISFIWKMSSEDPDYFHESVFSTRNLYLHTHFHWFKNSRNSPTFGNLSHLKIQQSSWKEKTSLTKSSFWDDKDSENGLLNWLDTQSTYPPKTWLDPHSR